MKARILVIDDEEGIRYTFKSFLTDEGHDVETAQSYREALDKLSDRAYDLIFADIILEGRNGLEILRVVRERSLLCPVIMITGEPNIETASEAVRLGAFDYIPKPVKQEKLLHVTRMALRHMGLLMERENYRTNLEAVFRSIRDGIITTDHEMNIVAMNESAMEICGLTRGPAGRSFPAVTAGCDLKCLEYLRETLATNRPLHAHRMECRLRGQIRVMDVTTSPLIKGLSTPPGAMIILRDVTHLTHLENSLGQRQQLLHLVGKSEKMQQVYARIDALAGVDTTVLISGESGTGKELVAEALHYTGGRKNKALVKVNCSALPDNLLESELFGHVRGAFTGAVADKVGRFERADGGTIFLDEIGELTPKVQLQMLRVLQEKTFERVGDSRPIKVDVRLVAATNKVLLEKVRQKEFREDLYYRLKVVDVHLPPLRERRDDIPLLVDHFIKKFNAKFNKTLQSISHQALRALTVYNWPGNVRELEHALEHAFVLCQNLTITLSDLPPELGDLASAPSFSAPDFTRDERHQLLQALEKASWNKAKAARLLGINRKTIYRKLEKFGLLSEGNPSF
ncbi:MAG: sigma 54-interacting transcriptional regulator [Pseudomonadota bacterium]